MLRARETSDIVNATLGLPILVEPDLREVVFGGMEGQPLHPWFGEWLAGRFTPEGAESIADITRRAAAVMARVLAHPGPLLIVSHGAFFRALRGVMRLDPEIRLENAVPILCEPVGQGWRATPIG